MHKCSILGEDDRLCLGKAFQEVDAQAIDDCIRRRDNKKKCRSVPRPKTEAQVAAIRKCKRKSKRRLRALMKGVPYVSTDEDGVDSQGRKLGPRGRPRRAFLYYRPSKADVPSFAP